MFLLLVSPWCCSVQCSKVQDSVCQCWVSSICWNFEQAWLCFTTMSHPGEDWGRVKNWAEAAHERHFCFQLPVFPRCHFRYQRTIDWQWVAQFRERVNDLPKGYSSVPGLEFKSKFVNSHYSQYSLHYGTFHELVAQWWERTRRTGGLKYVSLLIWFCHQQVQTVLMLLCVASKMVWSYSSFQRAWKVSFWVLPKNQYLSFHGAAIH